MGDIVKFDPHALGKDVPKRTLRMMWVDLVCKIFSIIPFYEDSLLSWFLYRELHENAYGKPFLQAEIFIKLGEIHLRRGSLGAIFFANHATEIMESQPHRYKYTDEIIGRANQILNESLRT